MNVMHNGTHFRYFARAEVYRLLSACFYQPEDAFLEEDVFGQLRTVMTKVCPDRVADVTAMDTCFRESGLEPLVLDYSHLFLGPFDILACPYGSIYLDGEKVVMGTSTMQALALYREGGFTVADDFPEVPDHAAVELEFLYLLSFRLGQAKDDNERTRLLTLKRRFLAEHLGRWIGALAEAMKRGAETDFYRRLAEVTEQVVLEDALELAEAA